MSSKSAKKREKREMESNPLKPKWPPVLKAAGDYQKEWE